MEGTTHRLIWALGSIYSNWLFINKEMLPVWMQQSGLCACPLCNITRSPDLGEGHNTKLGRTWFQTWVQEQWAHSWITLRLTLVRHWKEEIENCKKSWLSPGSHCHTGRTLKHYGPYSACFSIWHWHSFRDPALINAPENAVGRREIKPSIWY